MGKAALIGEPKRINLHCLMKVPFNRIFKKFITLYGSVAVLFSKLLLAIDGY